MLICTLKKIIYPTRGYTDIDYESPQKMSSKRYFLEAFSSQNNLIPTDSLMQETSLVFLDPSGINPPQGIYQDQTISVNVTATIDNEVNEHYVITIGLYNNTTNQLIEEQDTWVDLDYNAGNTVFNHVFDFDLEQDELYKIKLSFDPDSASTSPTYPPSPVMVNAYFDVVTGHDFVDWLGLRVKRVKNYADSLASPIVKRYYYNEALQFSSSIDKSVISYEPDFISYSESVSCCEESYPTTNPLVNNTKRDKVITLSSNSHNHFFPSTDSQSLYKNVTISYGGDNFENGGVEKNFLISTNVSRVTFPHPDNRLITSHLVKGLEHSENYEGMLNGKLLKEYTFLNGTPSNVFANDLRIVNEVDYTYENEIYDSAPNLTVVKLYGVCASTDPLNIDNLFIATYSTFAFKSVLKSQKNTTYIDPVPITDLDNASNYNSMSTTSEYEYESFAGQPTKVLSVTSDGNEIIETKNFYVDQVAQLTELTPNQITAYNTLENTHRLSNVIHSETSKIVGTNMPQLLSKQRTLYKSWNGGPLVLPEIVQSAKGNNNLEDRIVFYDYTTHGDLLEVSKADGSHIKYIYSPNSLVICKIENYEGGAPDFGTTNSPVCSYQTQHPNSIVTVYRYKNGTRLIESVEDTNCNEVSYEYLGNTSKLKHVKDKDGNILSTNTYNYQSQN